MTAKILVGDAQVKMEGLGMESINCVVTSPPYWGLRDYQIDGQLGLEPTPEEYAEKLVCVFRDVWRVLRKDGVVWLNLGDCYATGAGKVGDCPGGGEQGERWKGYKGAQPEQTKSAAMGPTTQPNRMPQKGLKPKDLAGIPWRVAFALQADGWWLRSDIIWSKPNPMPESVTDRPTKSHEYVFLLTKSAKYYYDMDAIREPHADIPHSRGKKKADSLDGMNAGDGWKHLPVFHNPLGRNKRTVWEIPTQNFSEAHFATFPEKLAEPCILAGCPRGGTVLDPYTGSGTVGVVAVNNERSFVGIELNPEYAEMGCRRINAAAPLFVTTEIE